ncbi:Uncharacterised protein [Mycobacteroides abscessus subsp. abscessus]|nr:Uncharacterised protein [Mycobacteroides abscessus subsp. abscessus]
MSASSAPRTPPLTPTLMGPAHHWQNARGDQALTASTGTGESRSSR